MGGNVLCNDYNFRYLDNLILDCKEKIHDENCPRKLRSTVYVCTEV